MQAAHQTISSGPVALTYQAFPDACRLKNGDILCVFYAGTGHVTLPAVGQKVGGRLCSVRSKDDGRTWSSPEIVFDGPLDDRDALRRGDRTAAEPRWPDAARHRPGRRP